MAHRCQSECRLSQQVSEAKRTCQTYRESNVPDPIRTSANGSGLVGLSPPNHLKTTEPRPTERNYTELVRWKKTLQQRHFRAGAAGANCGKLGNGGRGC